MNLLCLYLYKGMLFDLSIVTKIYLGSLNGYLVSRCLLVNNEIKTLLFD